MSWNLKGRAAIASLDPPTRYRVLHSHTMTRCANKPLLWVLEELITLRYLGGLTGPLHTANYFICLVVRLLQICPSVAIVRVMLEQDVHKYLRAAALLIIRLIGNAELQREAMRVGWSDYRKLCLYGSDPAQELAESTSTTAAGAEGVTAGTSRTLASSMLPLDHYKRSRAEMEMNSGNSNLASDARSGESDRANAQVPEPPQYWLIRTDEFTDYLFGVASASTASQGKEPHELLKEPASPPPNPSSPLDIEQQLRLREAMTTQRQSAEAAASLSYMHEEYYAAAGDAITLFGGICAVTGALFLASALLTKTRLANTVRLSFQRSGVSLIPKCASPPLFSVCMAAWMGLLGVQSVCDVLREVAQQHYRAVKEKNVSALADLSLLHRIHVGTVNPRPLWGLSTAITTQYPPLVQWIMTPTALLFAAQYAGMVCIWCYMLFCGQPLDAGLMGALLTFFPTFYDALLLNGNEPDRWPVWVTLVNFMISLICVWSFGAPLVRREYREVMRELQGHTAKALFKDRPEMSNVRAHGGARGGSTCKKSKQK